MDEATLFNDLLGSIIEEKGGNRDTYTSLLDIMAWHETGGTMDSTTAQKGGGPGRGKYQFENKSGSNRILTSAKRTKNYLRHLGKEVPESIKSIIRNGSASADTLSPTLQDILVLGDLRMKDGLDLSEYANGNLPVQDLWADHWWAGPKQDRPKRVKEFNRSLKSYEQRNTLNQFNTGGSHEENQHGGIPIGTNSKNVTNTVEQGETSIPSGNGSFIFSDRLGFSGLIPVPKK